MATIKKFEDLEIWQMSRTLTKELFTIFNDLKQVDFRFKSQILSSSGSISDNIAEGFERDGTREFIQFLSIAKGSAGELRSQLYRANDFEYITEKKLHELTKQAEQISIKINNFIIYLNKTELKGNKFIKAEKDSPLKQL